MTIVNYRGTNNLGHLLAFRERLGLIVLDESGGEIEELFGRIYAKKISVRCEDGNVSCGRRS